MRKLLLVTVLSFAIAGSSHSVELNVVLPDPYPEVYQKVKVLPFDPHGWYGHHHIFEKWIKENNVKML